MAWLKRILWCQACLLRVVGCPGLVGWCSAVRKFVLVKARAVVCLLRCWGECRGFRQLREGSDDPPPPVRIGASAWADATPMPASRLSRTVIIASARRSWETTCMTRKPLHQTSSGAGGPLINVLFAGKPSCLSTPDLHRIAGTVAEASRLSVTPVFHHTTGLTGNTQARSAHSTAMIPVFGHGRLLAASMRVQGNEQQSCWNQAGVAAMVGWLHAHIPPWRLPPLLICRPDFAGWAECGGGAGGKCRLSWGLSLD